jgi:hypothetical protein
VIGPQKPRDSRPIRGITGNAKTILCNDLNL